jgi:hypothetical protein
VANVVGLTKLKALNSNPSTPKKEKEIIILVYTVM